MLQPRTRSFLLAAAFAVGSAIPALAQSAGQITGTVKDVTGAAVPGATITVTQQETGASHVASSSGKGTFAVADLPAGAYTVTAELLGFRKIVNKDQQLAAGGTLNIDFTLEAKLAEEITVTAMKREQTVADVPFSVAAPTGDMLRARGVEDIEGVAANVGGFSVQNLGPGQSQVAMRGVSSGQIARDQPGVKEQVGAYLDESAISLSLFTPDIDLFDVSRVEVLRGPQGTLFGSGSLSGTVRYISNQPELNVKSFFGEFTGSTVHGGNQGGNAKLGFNAPLGNTAALRVAGYYDHFPGYIDSPGTKRTTSGGIQDDPATLKENVNTGYRAGVRAAIKIAPNDNLTITPRFIYQKVSTDGWNRVDVYNILANQYTTTRPPVTLGDREQFIQIPEPFTDKFALGDLNINYRFGDVDLTSITSYTHRDILVVRDAGALTSSITGGSIGLPENIYSLDAPLNDATLAKVWTQELRLSGGGKSHFKWVLGGFYSNLKRDYNQNLLVAGFEDLSGIHLHEVFAPKDVLFFSDLHYKLDQFAAFGEGTYDLNDQVSITGGLRYYRFTEDKAQVFDGLFGDDGAGHPVSQPGTTKANGVAPRLILTYKASDKTRLNAQVSKGFRLGGINDPLNAPLCTPQDLVTFGGREAWKDEKAWNYEVGSKSTILGGKGSFNIAAFYMDIRDLQATVTAGSCSSRVVFNVPKARSQGAEAEFQIAPNRNFDLSISGSVTDSKLKSTLTSTDPSGGVTIVSGIEDGVRLPSVPKFQIAASATYQWTVMQTGLAYVTGTFQHIGSRFTQVGDQDLGTLALPAFGSTTPGFPYNGTVFTYNPELPAYDLVNARVGVRKDKWDVALFGNNLTDERALLSLDRERGTRARIGFQTNQPRTFGITLGFKY